MKKLLAIILLAGLGAAQINAVTITLVNKTAGQWVPITLVSGGFIHATGSSEKQITLKPNETQVIDLKASSGTLRYSLHPNLPAGHCPASCDIDHYPACCTSWDPATSTQYGPFNITSDCTYNIS